ncbi:SH3 domain-containing protein [Mangrovimonas sp. DI 80]|uniref:SH3 domain-containing protein n=1 Tax=Mangrovimonas sp. DI 80 TaxID=1779330 RepID=UPI000976FC2C|nr:SH3 domain-containing protein [Mangrovimonas sp. DI 80]OMP29944.1 hypothetical protein BKM32_15180 [Mangrovimonas sp. DI 80]
MKTKNTLEKKNESLTNGLAITGLVLGILALVVSFIPCFGVYAILIGVIGLIVSLITFILASKNNYPKGLIIAALLTSLLSCSIAYWQKIRMQDAIEDFKNDLDKSTEQLQKDLEKRSEQFKKEVDELMKEQDEIDKKFIQEMKETDEEFIKKMNEIDQKPNTTEKVIEPPVETKKNEIDPLMSITITVDNLRARVSPSLTAEKIENLEINTEVEYLGMRSNEETEVEIKGEKISAYWYKIKTPSGNIGWIHGCCFTQTYD